MTRKYKLVQARCYRSSFPSLKQTWPDRKDREKLIFWLTSAGPIGSIFTSLSRTFLLRQKKVFAVRWTSIHETSTQIPCLGIGFFKMGSDSPRQNSISASPLHPVKSVRSFETCNSAD